MPYKNNKIIHHLSVRVQAIILRSPNVMCMIIFVVVESFDKKFLVAKMITSVSQYDY